MCMWECVGNDSYVSHSRNDGWTTFFFFFSLSLSLHKLLYFLKEDYLLLLYSIKLKPRGKMQNLVEWFSERGAGELTADELAKLKADTRTSFKSEYRQTIPDGFVSQVLLVLPKLERIDFANADPFNINLSFITYRTRFPLLTYVDFGNGSCTDEDIRALCASCPNLKYLFGLGNMHSLVEGDALNVTWLHSCPELLEVDLSGCKGLVDLRSFCHAPKLRVVRARNTNVYDLSSLLGCDLLELDVSGCAAVTNAEFVTRLPNLKTFRVADTGILSVEWIAECPSLLEVDVAGCKQLTDFTAVRRNSNLRAFVCRRASNLNAIEISDTLEELDLIDCYSLKDLSSLKQKDKLKVLRIGGTGVTSIDFITSCVNLEEVDVSGCYELHDLSPIGSLAHLRVLNAWCSGVNGIEWIKNCSKLTELNLQWAKTADLSPIASIPNLKKVRASGATECSWIANCTQLEEVDFSGSVNLEDLSPLSSIPHLKVVNASNTAVQKLGWLKNCTEIESLDFSWCSALRGANEISYCANLKVFKGFCSALVDVSYITRLQNIERVEVYRCPLGKPTIQALAELKSRGVVLQLAFFGANLDVPSAK